MIMDSLNYSVCSLSLASTLDHLHEIMYPEGKSQAGGVFCARWWWGLGLGR